MPYREKTAWLALVAMALTFGPYFAIVASGVMPVQGLPDLRHLMLFGGVATLQVLILGIGHWYLRRGARQDAHVPPDERDNAIELRAFHAAYYVLLAGMILVGCVMPFQTSGWRIVHAAIFMIIASEMVSYAVVVFSYRRQA
ncbi:MAG: hypothetical protein WKG03_17790 [Telluria sp.]